MTGPRAAPRNSPFLSPSTPKTRPSKSKSARPRSSPNQNRTSPNVSAYTAAVVSTAAAAAAAAAAVQPLQQASAHHHHVQMALQQMQQAATLQKRSRPSVGIVKEPDPKRTKQTASAVSSLAVPREPSYPPSSPTTSSRSRQRKYSKTRSTVSDGESSPAIAMSVATSVGGQRTRPPSSPKTPNARAPPLPSQVSCFSIEGTPFIPSVRPTSLRHRLFGHEIQCLMHAFGEVRYCARDVLEMTEDSARNVVIRVASLAHEYAVEEAAAVVNAGGAPMPKEVPVEIRHVVRCLKKDGRAVQRLNQSLKQSVEIHPNMLPNELAERTFTRTPKPWDMIVELASVAPKAPMSSPGEKGHPSNDIMSRCSLLALYAFRNAMTSTHFQDFAMCRGVTLVRQESKSSAPTVRGQSRITLFREWMNASQKLPFLIPDHTLFALGHIAWEAIGLITQTALLHRHFDDLAKGYGDPRAVNWSYPRHLVAALNYGLGTAVMVPITDIQAIALQQEIDMYLKAMQVVSQRWRGYSQASSPCLLPQHIREAVRRIERSPDSIFGFREESFLTRAGFM